MKLKKIISGFLFVSLFLNYTSFSQKPYNLTGVLQLAKTNSPELKMDFLNLQIAETDIITARLRPNPILNNQSLQLVRPASFPPGTSWENGQTRQIWWQVTKPLMLPSLRKNKIDFAEKNAGTSGLLYQEKLNGILYKVAGKWVDCWALAHQVNILQRTHAHVDSLLQTNKQQSNTSATELAKTRLKVDQYAFRLRILQQNYTLELSALKLLTGEKEDIKIDTASPFDFILREELDRLLQEALSHRADLLSIKSIGDAAAANIKLQKSLAWPTPELGAIYNPQNTIPYVGVFGTIQIPIFSRNQGEIKKSFLLKQQSEQHLVYKQLEVRAELLNAFTIYHSERQNITDLAKIREQSDIIYRSAVRAFNEKEMSLLNYLEEQDNWLEIEKLYYDTQNNYGRSYFHLLYVSGLLIKVIE